LMEVARPPGPPEVPFQEDACALPRPKPAVAVLDLRMWGQGDGRGGGRKLFPGSLKVQPSCQNVVYLAETPPPIWGPPQDNVWQDSDAVATPRGIVKIPDGCGCSVECDGGSDYKITCRCQFSPFGIKAPKTLPPGKEFPNPRDSGYVWAATRDSYVRTGGLPCPSCFVTEYVFN
jgi:hypothetical protein